MAEFIHGEESNKFENGLGNFLILHITHYTLGQEQQLLL